MRVERDQQPPLFDGLPYEPDIVSENVAIGTGVFTLQARDPDQKVSLNSDNNLADACVIIGV